MKGASGPRSLPCTNGISIPDAQRQQMVRTKNGHRVFMIWLTWRLTELQNYTWLGPGQGAVLGDRQGSEEARCICSCFRVCFCLQIALDSTDAILLLCSIEFWCHQAPVCSPSESGLRMIMNGKVAESKHAWNFILLQVLAA